MVDTPKSLQDVLDNYPDVFTDELGTVKGITATIHVNPEATRQFHKARPLPFMLRKKVKQELERLQEQGVIEPVQLSDWAAPVVPVLKKDGSIRLCGN